MGWWGGGGGGSDGMVFYLNFVDLGGWFLGHSL